MNISSFIIFLYLIPCQNCVLCIRQKNDNITLKSDFLRAFIDTIKHLSDEFLNFRLRWKHLILKTLDAKETYRLSHEVTRTSFWDNTFQQRQSLFWIGILWFLLRTSAILSLQQRLDIETHELSFRFYEGSRIIDRETSSLNSITIRNLEDFLFRCLKM